jgi:RNA ligase
MKPLNYKNYGSIPHLSNSNLGDGDYLIQLGQELILTEKKRDAHDQILVFEKYDGTNVGIAKKNGKIFALNRAGYEAKTSPYKQHHLFDNWVRKREKLFDDLLSEGERIVGEWLVQAHSLIYNITGEPIVFFDFFDANSERALFEILQTKINTFQLHLPRLIHKGEPIKVEELLPILYQKTKNIESVELPEGLVYRVERKNKVDFLAKWVRADFPIGRYFIDVPEDKLTWNVNIDML